MGGTAWQVCLAMGCMGSGMTGPDLVEVAMLAAAMSPSGKQPPKQPPLPVLSHPLLLSSPQLPSRNPLLAPQALGLSWPGGRIGKQQVGPNQEGTGAPSRDLKLPQLHGEWRLTP